MNRREWDLFLAKETADIKEDIAKMLFAGRGMKMSVCDDCERADYWECRFCCAKCYEDYGECPNPDCDPMDI